MYFKADWECCAAQNGRKMFVIQSPTVGGHKKISQTQKKYWENPFYATKNLLDAFNEQETEAKAQNATCETTFSWQLNT